MRSESGTGDGGTDGRPGWERRPVNSIFRRGSVWAAALLFSGMFLLVPMEMVAPEAAQRPALYDVGNNCNWACMLGALGAAFGAFGAALGDPWGNRARDRALNQYRHRRQENARYHPSDKPDPYAEWKMPNPYPGGAETPGDANWWTSRIQAAVERVVGEPATGARGGMTTSIGGSFQYPGGSAEGRRRRRLKKGS